MKRTTLMVMTLCALCALGPVSAAGSWRYAASGSMEAASTDPTTSAVAESTVTTNQDLPGNYMSMTTVSSVFGEPDNQAPAVGQPPITRWYYPRYTVYFEHDRVITSVKN